MFSLKNLFKEALKRKIFLDLVFTSIIILFTWNVSKRFMTTGLSHDESMLVFGGYGILHGMVPYKDFFELKPVMALVMNALGILFFGLKNCGFKYIVPTSTILALILFYFAMLKLKIFRVFAMLICVFTSYLYLLSDFHDWGNNDFEIYGAIFSILSFSSLFLIDKTIKGIHLSHFFAGAFFAMAVLTKEPYLFTLIAFSPFAFFSEKPLTFHFSRFKSLFFGFCFFIGLFFCYMLFTGALEYYIDRMQYTMAYAKDFHSIAGVQIPSNFKDLIIYDWNKISNYLHNFSYFKVLFPFYIAVLIFNKFNFKTILCILGMIGGLAGIAASHTFWKHNFIIGMFSLVLPSVLGAKDLSIYFSRNFNSKNFFRTDQNILFRLVIVFIFLIYYSNKILVPFYKDSCSGSYSYHQPDGVLPGSFIPKVLPAIRKFTNKNDKILVVGDTIAYPIAERKPISRIAYATDNFFKISTRKINLSSYMETIEKENPKLVYIQFNFPHTGDLIKHYVFPYIRTKHYFSCGNGIYLRETPNKEDIAIYCEDSVDNFVLSEKSIPIKGSSASNTHSSQWVIENAFDGDLGSDWATRGSGNESITIFLENPERIKSIYLYSRQPYTSYQGWRGVTAKFYLNNALTTSRYFSLPDANKSRLQELNLNSALTDKIELYLSDANHKTPDGKIADHPIDSGYTEIILKKE